MSIFVIGFYTLLLAGSTAAAYFNYRQAFMLLFSLTLVSFVLGIIGGAGALQWVAICAGLLALSAMISYAFREFLILIVSDNMAKELRTAPLTAAFGMFVIFTYAIAAIFAPMIAPHGEAEVISSAFAPADENMLLGADQLGRDMFSRLIYGARNTISLALVGTVLAFTLGALAGLLAAVRGGWFDQAMGRSADVIMSIPSLIFGLLMVSIFGSLPTNPAWLNLFGGNAGQADFVLGTAMMVFFGMLVGLLVLATIAENLAGWIVKGAIVLGIVVLISMAMSTIFNSSEIILILVVSVIYSPRVYRLTRAVAGNVVVMDYIEAARLRGERRWYLIRREILPNSTAPLVAEFGLEFCFVFLLISGLSFLGLGIQPPTADWGSMVKENATLISFGEITPLIPAAAIALLTVAVNFVVDWMLFRSSGLKEQ
ncbi:ABC transporter permease [Roseovarius nubinhibens]|jgi:peptide/nickel transport system permease protein|uniref:ABC peptide transporter, inner membrane subunit n=1 Tax=Roseovarius nubinhibens (strain ATCC BAA-591 / DSM 15170 / ISM) TaxID=89187 RepID=A3SHW9_ROSNI|nr:ABC transporter permease [Roseovarius nubinhibens]EAP76950.1 ABC peptide transporter, inner membrane subunit [Roseovarius nubinhibens ISM]MBU2998238.1 ABC transporter permease [Roseovarius nubinhibens]